MPQYHRSQPNGLIDQFLENPTIFPLSLTCLPARGRQRVRGAKRILYI
jgi:hypothetical protein